MFVLKATQNVLFRFHYCLDLQRQQKQTTETMIEQMKE